MSKIAELTKMHKLAKEKKEQRKGESLSSDEEDVAMASDDDAKEESKDASKSEKKFPNKGSLHPSKVKNKQKQKEAIKKNKIKRTKGTSKLASDATAAQEATAE